LRKPPQFDKASQGGGVGKLSQRVVLVVDDERFMVDLIAGLLESEGFEVMRAHDGVQALQAIDRRRPDLVIADIYMPGLDGISLARRVRQEENPIPIILMSASRRQMTASDVPFVAKPFEIDDLVALARQNLSDATPGTSAQIAITG
jgi:CheY-like chemotaxis protein